jgi:hypothetical protein
VIELNARGADKAILFESVRLVARPSRWAREAATDLQPRWCGRGRLEMNPMVPAEVPSYWMVYFDVDDVDAAYKRAIDGGAHEMMAPDEFPGGRYAIVSDPLGAAFGLLKLAPR